MKTKLSLKQLKVSYSLTVIVILALLAISQTIIQFTLRQEVEIRGIGGDVAIQALYAQAVLKNTLELIISPGNKTWSGKLQKDLTYMVPEEQKLLGNELSPTLSAQLKEVDPSFQQMVQAAREIILDTQQYDPKNRARLHDQGEATLVVFNTQGVYLPGLVTIFNTLSTQADTQVATIQLVEICLFALSVLTVLSEFFFIARPGLKGVQRAFVELQEVEYKLEQAEGSEKEEPVENSQQLQTGA